LRPFPDQADEDGVAPPDPGFDGLPSDFDPSDFDPSDFAASPDFDDSPDFDVSADPAESAAAAFLYASLR
jgi:hypothetical protein